MTDSGAPPGPAEEAQALVRDGRAFFAVGEVERARECFARALELVPENPEARGGLERCTRLMSDPGPPPGDSASTPAWAGRPIDEFDSDGGAPEATVVDPLYALEAEQELARLPPPSQPPPLPLPRRRTGEFPEPPTMPAGQSHAAHMARLASLTPASTVSGGVDAETSPSHAALPRAEPAPAAPAPGAPPSPGAPAYPRYSASSSRHYPDVLPGGRQPSGVHGGGSPAPVAPAVPGQTAPGPAGPGLAGPGPVPYVVAYPQIGPGGAAAYSHYATPVGAPPVGATKPPSGVMNALADPRYRKIVLGAAAFGCLLVGFLLGFAAFGGDDDGGARPAASDSAPVDASPVATARGGTATPPVPDAGVAPVGAPHEMSARARSVEHPVIAAVSSPSAGTVVRVNAAAGADVKVGAKLFTIRAPVAKKSGKQPQIVVTAPAAGRFEPRADKAEAEIAEGNLLAHIVDPAMWLVTVDLAGDAVAPPWGCEVSTADGASRTPCTVQRIERLGGTTRATAAAKSDGAAWLDRAASDLVVTVRPPAGAP